MSIDPLHPAALPIDALLDQCAIAHTRRGGPGRQHRNKVSTAVVITHKPTGIRAEASERRSQSQNRGVAIFRLRIALALDVRIDATDTPSALWQSRCRNQRIAINPEHEDFPAMLAESLNVIAHHEYDVAAAAEALRCSTSQLVKLLKVEPRALERVNLERAKQGLHRLI